MKEKAVVRLGRLNTLVSLSEKMVIAYSFLSILLLGATVALKSFLLGILAGYMVARVVVWIGRRRDVLELNAKVNNEES